MRSKRFFKIGGGVLAVLALCALLLLPGRVSALAAPAPSTVSVNANVYLTDGMLQSLFQGNVDQEIPQAVQAVIANIVNQLPKQDQNWASEMAGALLQPSATLISVTPQAQGLLVTLKVSLYQGDPKPLTVSLLVGFSVARPSTIQVTSLPINGKPGLISGTLMTFHMPIGSLNTVSPLTKCGDADLGIGLKFPISLSSQSQTTGQTQTSGGTVELSDTVSGPTMPRATAPGQSSYIELPASSLAQLGSGLGTMTISSSLTAQNIKVGVKGSNLTLTSDIHWYGLLIGTAVSTVAPEASKGDLVMHVTNTTLQILGGLISFPLNKYNQQIEQELNAELSGALAGKFNVAQAAIGPNTHLPCAASTSLVMGGTISLS